MFTILDSSMLNVDKDNLDTVEVVDMSKNQKIIEIFLHPRS